MYLASGEQSRFYLVSFLGNRSRPGFVPFMFAVLNSDSNIQLFQHALSLLCFSFLILAVFCFSPLHTLLKSLLVVSIACIASLPTTTIWNDQLMSESIALSVMAFLSAVAFYLWGTKRFSHLTVQPLACLAAISLGTLVLGPLRPFSLLFTSALGIRLIQLKSRSLRERDKICSQRTPPKKVMPWGLVGVSFLLLVMNLYVVAVDQNSNRAWGEEFAGLEDFDGRAIQQLTVVSDSSEWSYGAYWFYIKSINDSCVTAGFEAGQYWPATAMQCPDGIRELAGVFTRHYAIDYLRSIPSHWNETVSDYLTAWHFIDLPAGFGYDLIPSWARGLLLNPTSSDSDSPNVIFWIYLISVVAYAVGLFKRFVRFSHQKGPQNLREIFRSSQANTIFPFALLGASLVAVILTIIFSPGDPRVGIVHTTGARIWIFAWGMSVLNIIVRGIEKRWALNFLSESSAETNK